MSKDPPDLSGQQFGNWTVIRVIQERAKNGEFQAWCRCACGRTGVVKLSHLKTGHSTQCKRCMLKKRRSRFGIKEELIPISYPEEYEL